MTTTRRAAIGQIARAATGVAAAAILPGCSRASASDPLRKLRGGAGVFVNNRTPAGGTIAWVATPQSAVIVDTQFPEAIREFLTRFQRRSASELSAVINTHHHRDHTSGNVVVHPVAGLILAHANVPGYLRKAAEEWPEALLALPDTTFADHWSIDLNGEVVTARYYGPAHTGGDVVVRFERANVVHLGDLVYNRFHPHLDRDRGGTIVGWIHVLDRVLGDHAVDTLFVCSHARPGYDIVVGVAELRLQRDYLQAVLEHVKAGRRRGLSHAEAAAATELRGFESYVAMSERFTLSRILSAAWEEAGTL